MTRSLRTYLSQSLLLGVLSLIASACLGRRDYYITPEQVFVPGLDSTIMIIERLDGAALDLDLRAWRVTDPGRFMLEQVNPHLPGTPPSEDDDYATGDVDTDDPGMFELVAEWTEHLREVEYRRFQDRRVIPISKPGLYVVEARGGGRRSTMTVLITSIEVVVKRIDGVVLAFVASRILGERESGATITAGATHREGVRGTTGADGVARLMLPAGYLDSASAMPGIVVVAEHEGSIAIALPGSGIHRSGSSATSIYLYTDRPLYQPGDSVSFRAIIRRMALDGTLELPSERTARATLVDPDGTIVAEDTLAISDLGTVSGAFATLEEGRRGVYTVNVAYGKVVQQTSIELAEHQTASFDVRLEMSRDRYGNGDELQGIVTARRYSGEPLVDAMVEYTIVRAPVPQLYQHLISRPDFGGYMPPNLATIHKGHGRLDGDGRLVVTFRPYTEGVEGSIFRITARVTDASRRSVSTTRTVSMLPATRQIVIETDRMIYREGDRASMTMTILNSGRALSDSIRYRARVRRFAGATMPRILVDTVAAAAPDVPVTHVFPTAEFGTYSVSVEVIDSSARPLVKERSIYVLSSAQCRYLDTMTTWSMQLQDNPPGLWHTVRERQYDDPYNGNGLIFPDRSEYRVGDTILALCVVNPIGQDALITLEGEAIHDHRVEPTGSRAFLIKLPVRDYRSRQMFIGLATVSYSATFITVEPIRILPHTKLLTISSSPDREKYEPGDSASIRFRATDPGGRPVPDVDIGVSIVDEALYALKGDRAPSLFDHFYPIRPNRVGSAKGRAFWFSRPSGQPHEDTPLSPGGGSATPRPTRRRSTPGNSTGDTETDTRAAAQDRFTQPVVIRDEFPESALWSPSIRTDERGEARIDLELPDNLTSWRITARGVTGATEVGESTTSMLTNRDVVARLVVPGYLTEGDSLTVAGVVRNNSDHPAELRVRLSGTGVQIVQHDETVLLEPRSESRVDWRVAAPVAGPASLEIVATGGPVSDGERRELTVHPRSIQRGIGESLSIDSIEGREQIRLDLPEGVDARESTLSLRVGTSAVSPALSALDQLIGYPYGCVEQTMNRFHPVTVIARTLDRIDVPFDQKRREELPKMVAAGLARLYSLQNPDGTWGWFKGEGDPMMTAYVLTGLSSARAAGYRVDNGSVERAARGVLRFIEEHSSGKDRSFRTAAVPYLLYAATLVSDRNSHKIRRRLEALAEEQNLEPFSLAMLSLAAVRLGEHSLAAELAGRLESAARTSGRNIYWSGGSARARFGSSPVEATSAALRALVATGRNPGLARRAVGWLMTQRSGGSWASTWHSAVAIDAVTDYLLSSSELDTDYEAVIRVNGTVVHSMHVTRANLGEPERIIRIDRTLIRSGANRVTVEKKGVGELTVGASLGYAERVTTFAPDTAGFVVSREYHLLRRHNAGGSSVLVREPFTGVLRSGDEMLVTVRFTPTQDYEYAMLEDPIPPGFVVVEDSDWYRIQGTASNGTATTRSPLRWIAGAVEVRNGIQAFFAPSVSRSVYETSFVVRAELPGVYMIPPAVASLAYFPDVRGSTGSMIVRVE